MNHFTALEHKNGGWHYVSSNSRNGITPIGFCRDHPPHATEEEARWCYTKYLTAKMELVENYTSNWNTCRLCPTPTKSGAMINDYMGNSVPLCPKHLNIGNAAELLYLNEPATDSWVS